MSRDTSFYYSFLVLPPRKRQAIIAVWDFCRAVDDAVDEAGEGSEPGQGLSPVARARAGQALDAWRHELTAAFEGRPVTAQGQALQPFVREFGLPRQAFVDLIDGVAMDLDHRLYRTFDELAEYCRRVASTVGLICVEIFGYRDPAARTYAHELGMALQLTNIIRDVSADLRQGRLYLPLEDMDRFGVRESDFAEGVRHPGVRRLLEFQCLRARDFYRRAAAALPAVDRRSLVAAEIMGAIYSAILDRIERNGGDVFGERVRVPRPHRAAIALRIWAASFFR